LGASRRTAPYFIPLPGRIVLLAVLVLSGLAYALLSAYWHEGGALWIAGALVTGYLVYLFIRLFAELAALRRLEQGIHNAREGLLDATRVEPYGWTYVGRLISEYNTTISTLRLMFRTVEECQVRFINERNRSNTILQSLPGALLSLADDLRVTIANRQAEALFDSEKLIGANLFDLLLPERARS
jgi:nitrogen fixation/metabolism regulation signal transduction histidine kinase